MRAPGFLSPRSGRGRLSRSSGPRRPSRLVGGGIMFHALAAFFMVLSLVAPLTTAASAAPGTATTASPSRAQEPRPGTPPPLPAPTEVSVVGTFPPGACPTGACALSEEAGIWTGTFPIPAGRYTFRLSAVSDLERSIGEGGDPEGDDIDLRVPNDAAGVYFSYNTHTGEIIAEPIDQFVTLASDLGAFDFAPIANGQYELYLDSPAGTYAFQVEVDGQPVGAPDQISLDVPARVHLIVDGSGTVLVKETVTSVATLTVNKSDGAGVPWTNACFAVYDDNDLLGQACDTDDGSSDGTTTIPFPNGVDPGTYTLAETATDEGDPSSDEQQIQLSPGPNSAEAVAVGDTQDDPTEEPTETATAEDEPDETETAAPIVPDGASGALVVTAQDRTGTLLVGACFTLTPRGDTPGDEVSACDGDDGLIDGTTTFANVAAGPYRLENDTAPEGFDAADRQNIDVPANDTGFATVELEAEEEATEAPGATLGSLTILTRDDEDAVLTGACYTVTNRAGTFGPFCDDDGDGQVILTEVLAGENTISESTPPAGFEAPDDETVDIEAGEAAEVSFEHRADAEDQATEVPQPTGGSVVVTVIDEDGNLVFGACFEVDGAGVDEVCDNGPGDTDPIEGVIGIDEIPVGSYNLQQTTPPEGHQAAADEPVEIGVDFPQEVTVVNPTAQATGDLVVLRVDDDGQSVGGACVRLEDDAGNVVAAEVCDEDGDVADDGRIGFFNVPEGIYTLVETRTPEGFEPADDDQVEITAGIANQTQFASAPEEEPTIEPTVEATITPTPEPATGALLVTVRDEDDQDLTGFCVALAPADGSSAPAPACDGDEGDQDDDEGSVGVEDLPVGGYTLTFSQTPEGYDAPEAQTVTIEDGGIERVEIVLQATAPTLGAMTITIEDENGDPLPGASVEVINGAGTFPFNDQDGDGQIILDVVLPGPNTIRQTTPPVDYTPAEGQAEQTVEVVAGERAQVTITNQRAIGSVRILKTDENGDPLGGACFSLSGRNSYGPVCDDGQDDGDETVGTILIEDVALGRYTVTETQAPEGYDPADAQPVTVSASGPAELTVPNSPPLPETGVVEITLLDSDGNALGGACFGLIGATEIAPVCDAGDDPDAAGTIVIADVPAGDYTLTQTEAPDGYVAADDQPVRVTAGQTLRLELTNQATPPPVGSIVVSKVDADGQPLPGACFSLAGPEAQVCDGDPETDPAGDPGVVRFDDLDVGSYTVTETDPPDGYVAAEAQRAVVTPDGETELTFVNQLAPPETGSVRIRVRSEGGDDVSGGCFALRTADGTVAEACDNEDGDADEEDAVILLEEVPVGSYSVVQTDAPEGFQAAEQGTVTVIANETVEVIVIIVQLPPTTGTVLVTKRDEQNRRLEGACFALSQTEDIFEVCDNLENNGDGTASDGDGTAGRIQFNDVPAGEYQLRETRPPVGYLAAENVTVIVEGGKVARVTVVDQPVPDTTGDLVVLKVDQRTGEALGGACFELLGGPNRTVVVAGPVCDEDGDVADDGRIGIFDVPAGTYTLRETRLPSADYFNAGDRDVSIVAGTAIEVTVENALRPGTVTIEKENEGGELLDDACFALRGETTYELCDEDDGDTDGVTVFNGVVPGDYAVVETVAPVGYATAPDQSTTVTPGGTRRLTFTDVLLPPPPQVGNLIILKTDEEGDPLAGSCFALRQGAVVVAGPRCDGADGANDGTIRFEGVAIGDYTARETRTPSASYQRAADVAVTIRLNETAQVTVRNVLKPGRVLVRKTGAGSQPLQGACFDLAPDGKPSQCTDAAGTIVFGGLRPGTYRLSETQAPAGYLAAAPVEGIVVKPGATTVVNVEDRLAPPPPNTGSIQVLKFYCPAGDAGEGTEIIDSSNPGASRLARTANCSQGNATFNLIDARGEGGPGTFSTGDDGRYQTTVTAGEYRLTETAPDLPGDAAETVRISVNQLTTVVVINYVKPPAPAPASISVVKYTCQPGFEGTLFADFVDNCGDDTSLTNNVTFRVSGTSTGKHVTGDGGQKGVTVFGRLPAGQYLLREDAPADASVVYAFCGLDPNAPTLKELGGSITLTPKAGENLTCTFFNVPEDLSATTGAILIHKYACAVENPPAGYDFKNECDPETNGATFSLALYNAEQRTFQPKSTGTTNADGLLRFSRLQPGTYRVRETGEDWCFAQSNSVDRNGDVIVKANQRAEVWIYNCVGTRGAPNTGTGSSLPGGQGALNAATTMALGLAWPLLGWGLYLRRRAA